jgi:hypothetical protein
MRPLVHIVHAMVLAFDRPTFGLTSQASRSADDAKPLRHHRRWPRACATMKVIDNIGRGWSALMARIVEQRSRRASTPSIDGVGRRCAVLPEGDWIYARHRRCGKEGVDGGLGSSATLGNVVWWRSSNNRRGWRRALMAGILGHLPLTDEGVDGGGEGRRSSPSSIDSMGRRVGRIGVDGRVRCEETFLSVVPICRTSPMAEPYTNSVVDAYTTVLRSSID